MRWWLALLVGCSAAPSADRSVATVEVEPSGVEPSPADDEEPSNPSLPPPNCDPQSAQVFFAQGKEAMAVGLPAVACAKFEESQRCDAAVGTLLNLSRCYEQLGDKARACEKLEAANAMGATDGRRPFIQQRAQSLGC